MLAGAEPDPANIVAMAAQSLSPNKPMYRKDFSELTGMERVAQRISLK